MTTLYCSAKLLKRLRQPVAESAPPGEGNPLGPWSADIDFIDREPFAVLMNAATGMILVLPARAADLRRLHVMAAEQAAALFRVCGLDSPLAQAELDALAQPFSVQRNTNRSLVASMNLRKFEASVQFAHNGLRAFDVALRMLETPFSRKELPKGFHYAIDRLRSRLQPSATILAFPDVRVPRGVDARQRAAEVDDA